MVSFYLKITLTLGTETILLVLFYRIFIIIITVPKNSEISYQTNAIHLILPVDMGTILGASRVKNDVVPQLFNVSTRVLLLLQFSFSTSGVVHYRLHIYTLSGNYTR